MNCKWNYEYDAHTRVFQITLSRQPQYMRAFNSNVILFVTFYLQLPENWNEKKKNETDTMEAGCKFVFWFSTFPSLRSLSLCLSSVLCGSYLRGSSLKKYSFIFHHCHCLQFSYILLIKIHELWFNVILWQRHLVTKKNRMFCHTRKCSSCIQTKKKKKMTSQPSRKAK